MGLLVNGVWQDKGYDTKSTNGKFKREATTFHGVITADDSTEFSAESDRYHLYVSLACPWAHRALLFRRLKGLEKVISLSIVDPNMAENGWEFSDNEGCIIDSVNHCNYLHQVYTLADPHYTGRVTVPVLWDKKNKTIVCNESAEIIRMLNSAFNEWGNDTLDFYPQALQKDIDEINEFVYKNINNGVYRCGFATEQSAYEEACQQLFDALDKIEQLLAKQKFLVGDTITEADWRLFTTLIRFDAVYVGHFKCNIKRIVDYKNIHCYLQYLYQFPGVAETVNFDHIKKHYYISHTSINPTKIVPMGPQLIL